MRRKSKKIKYLCSSFFSMCPLILHIETSTELCSVALSRGSSCLAVRENSEGRNHATMLTSFIDDLLKETNVSVKYLDAIAVSSGPGSYTGLRIGLSTAKGLCYGGAAFGGAVAEKKYLIRIEPGRK